MIDIHARTPRAIMNEQVMEMINCKKNPLTAKDLHRLADMKPDLYGPYRTLLDDKGEGEPND